MRLKAILKRFFSLNNQEFALQETQNIASSSFSDKIEESQCVLDCDIELHHQDQKEYTPTSRQSGPETSNK